jgi:oxygen-independent coproporphyrinogen III oxidase
VSTDAPGLYLHLPFCSEVCPYCDFAVVKASAPRRLAFADSLAAEMALVPPQERGGFDTVYFGGGTPSLLPPEVLGAILAAARRQLGVRDDARVFLEANPEDVTPAALAAWRELGVHLLSLGIQSFDDAELAFLGRRHDGVGARRAVERALAAGFPIVSVDLIYGLPSQDPAAWRRNLETAVALGSEHLSCYQLTVAGGTAFGTRRARGELAELPEAEQAQRFELTHAFLADQGYPAYEVSNFARAPELRSRHNQKYWRGAPYLGLGPSAHSFDGGLRRWWNERRLDIYQRRLRAGERPIAGSETLTLAERALEAVMLALRTAEGLDLAAFAERFGRDLVAEQPERLAKLVDEGLLEPPGTHLRATRRGLAVVDGLAAALG